jgi:hypothetical protein
MQTSNIKYRVSGAALGAALLMMSAAGSAVAFDIRSSFAPDTPSADIFKFGFNAYKDGRSEEAVEALRYAAEKGHAGSMWKLGNMYQYGDGVERNDAEAFRLFAEIANRHADVRPGSTTARFVASSFVSLGRFYEQGSAQADIEINPRQARRYYEHAAFYFGDADAQFHLARFLLSSEDISRSTRRQAHRSLLASAQKGHARAAAKLGAMLVEGKYFKRDIVQGLKFLTIALRQADMAQRLEIQPVQEHAYSIANEEQRRQAVALAQAN